MIALELGNSRRHLAAKCDLGEINVARRSLKFFGEKRRGYFGGPRFGGREWESNPPKTGSRPPPDLKSGRPTGGDSLPLIGD
jgi:hypothetical protein